MPLVLLLSLLVATPPPESPSPTQIWQNVMLTLIAAGVLWIARTVFFVRDEVRDLKHEVVGRDGQNGIKSAVRRLTDRVDDLEDWRTALDAVAEAERAQYHGEERRQNARRLRDRVLDQLRQERGGDPDRD